ECEKYHSVLNVKSTHWYVFLNAASDIVLVCGSDRSIQVFDMNKGAVASELPDAHSRAIHCIAQNKESRFSTQAPDSHNLFLTSAVTDGVKIWDLRTLRCVRRYENHVNRCHPCSSAISPCGRFIASGSEDNCAYVYDIRSSSYLHKLQKFSETVLSVTFHPGTPEVGQFFFTVLLLFLISSFSSVIHSTFTRLSPLFTIHATQNINGLV
uniref:Uncharacterized protein n=1 Tax=Mola mola TaxID=94237 RepID=A0A3Q3VZB6_MOLML